MNNLKFGDKVVYIGGRCDRFTVGKEYKVLRTVEECKEGGVSTDGRMVIGIEDNSFYNHEEYHIIEQDVIHYLTEEFFNSSFKIKGEC